MDLPGELQSALGSTYRVEHELGHGGMAADPHILPYPTSSLSPLSTEPVGAR